MNLIDQLRNRRQALKKKATDIAQYVGIAPSNISAMLSGKRDLRASTLEAFANVLDAQWVLIPRHLIPEIERLLSGQAIAPDNVPSSVERMFSMSNEHAPKEED